jgi:hypothetical protein
LARGNPVSRAAYKLARHIFEVLRTAFPHNRPRFQVFEDPDYIAVIFQGPKVEGRRLWAEDFWQVAIDKQAEWIELGDSAMSEVRVFPDGYALVFTVPPTTFQDVLMERPAENREDADELVENPRGDLPPGFRVATRLFEDFHQYDVSDTAAFPESLVIPETVHYPGPCVYVTYLSDKWNDGTHPYIHEIESFPRVNVGLVGGRLEQNKRVPKRVCDNTTVVQLKKKALGYSYMEPDTDKQIELTVRNCEWFWHPQGKALLLIRNKRKLVAIIWGGKLDWKPEGLVG